MSTDAGHAPGPAQTVQTVLRDHPLRNALTNEVHARPYERLAAPVRVTHLAMLSGEGADEAERRHLARLCARAGVPPPPEDATHHSTDLGPFRLKWERHTEFSTWTVFRPDPAGAAFADTAAAALPVEWLAALPGERLVGVHLALVPQESPLASPEGLTDAFGSDNYLGSWISGQGARCWTDFRIHGDGFSRVVVAVQHLSPRQAGRMVQRLLEIETYRMMALLALPPARSVLPRMSGIEAELAGLTQRTAAAAGPEDEQALLRALTRLAAAAEQIAAETSYRFSAARAYADLVERRVSELREQRIEGLQTIGEFMTRRLQPAIRTCEAVAARREALSARIARASNLLRTRVDLALESQNRDLLQSMDRRAQLQLRLQETVEGLSVVAISYYLLGLIGYAAKGLKAAGLPVDPDVAAAAAIPVVLVLVWAGVRRLRHALIERP